MGVLEEIAAERKRQIEVEGWSARHDDLDHQGGELAKAAACYAAPLSVSWNLPDRAPANDHRRLLWPWDRDWWKPKDERRNLIRAAALLVAEIERLDRKAVQDARQDEAARSVRQKP